MWSQVITFSNNSFLRRTGEIPIMSAQSSQQVCLAANNKLISLDCGSQLTLPAPTGLSFAISSLFSLHCLRVVIEGQFVMVGPRCNLCCMTYSGEGEMGETVILLSAVDLLISA